MSHEKQESKSENYVFQEEWEAFNKIGEITLLPLTILEKLAGDSLGF